jgi:hypothetical protein
MSDGDRRGCTRGSLPRDQGADARPREEGGGSCGGHVDDAARARSSLLRDQGAAGAPSPRRLPCSGAVSGGEAGLLGASSATSSAAPMRTISARGASCGTAAPGSTRGAGAS